jgi:hypothetical protein
LPGSDDERRLKVEYGDRRCDLLAEDCGRIDMELYPPAGGGLAPEVVADIAAFLLEGKEGHGQDRESEDPGLNPSFRRIIGTMLRNRGLHVGLDVYEDSASFEVIAELEISDPVRAPGAIVRVSDDGTVAWEWDCPDSIAGITDAPDRFTARGRRGELAGSIAGKVFRAVSISCGRS